MGTMKARLNLQISGQCSIAYHLGWNALPRHMAKEEILEEEKERRAELASMCGQNTAVVHVGPLLQRMRDTNITNALTVIAQEAWTPSSQGEQLDDQP